MVFPTSVAPHYHIVNKHWRVMSAYKFTFRKYYVTWRIFLVIVNEMK